LVAPKQQSGIIFFFIKLIPISKLSIPTITRFTPIPGFIPIRVRTPTHPKPHTHVLPLAIPLSLPPRILRLADIRRPIRVAVAEELPTGVGAHGHREVRAGAVSCRSPDGAAAARPAPVATAAGHGSGTAAAPLASDEAVIGGAMVGVVCGGGGVVVGVGQGEFGDVEGKRRRCAIGEAGALVVVGFGVGPILELEGFPAAELQHAGVYGVARVQRLVRHRLSHHRHTR